MEKLGTREIPISTLVPSQQSSENLFLVPLTLNFLERMRIVIDFFAPVKESFIARNNQKITSIFAERYSSCKLMFEAAAECRRPLLQFQSKRVRMFQILAELALEDFEEDDDEEEDEDDDDDDHDDFNGHA